MDELKVERGITTEVMTHTIVDNQPCTITVVSLGTYSATTSGVAAVEIKVKADPQAFNPNLRHYVIR